MLPTPQKKPVTISSLLDQTPREATEDCVNEVKSLENNPSFERLLDFCAATRIGFGCIFEATIETGENYEWEINEFRLAVHRCLSASVVIRRGLNEQRTKSREASEQFAAISKYLSSIRLRHELIDILEARGVEAVFERLREVESNLAPNLAPETETKNISQHDRLHRQSSDSFLIAASASWSFSRILKYASIDLLREAGPYLASSTAHYAIARRVLDRTNVLISKIDDEANDVELAQTLAEFGATREEFSADVVDPLETLAESSCESRQYDEKNDLQAKEELKKIASSAHRISTSADNFYARISRQSMFRNLPAFFPSLIARQLNPSNSRMNAGIPAYVSEAKDAFTQDLPNLLLQYPDKWAIYLRGKRLGIGADTRASLYKEHAAEAGLNAYQLIVFKISLDALPELD